MATQLQKAETFRRLHTQPGIFVIPNPWDAGTARLLEHMGFEALATTSMGYAFTQAKPDASLGREETLAGVKLVVDATDLPVSADLENGFGDSPEDAAETIRRAAAIGLVGGSIEDASRNPDDPIYAFGLSVDRVRAAVEAARSLPFPFTLTARAEDFLHGRIEIRYTIKRLQAFQEAGADVLYAPGLVKKEDIAAVVSSVDRPVNVLMGLGQPMTVPELGEMGVKRISVGSTLMRTALGAFLRAAKEIRERGTFTFAADAAKTSEVSAVFAPPAAREARSA